MFTVAPDPLKCRMSPLCGAPAGLQLPGALQLASSWPTHFRSTPLVGIAARPNAHARLKVTNNFASPASVQSRGRGRRRKKALLIPLVSHGAANLSTKWREIQASLTV
jgi:hypothetical protein